MTIVNITRVLSRLSDTASDVNFQGRYKAKLKDSLEINTSGPRIYGENKKDVWKRLAKGTQVQMSLLFLGLNDRNRAESKVTFMDTKGSILGFMVIAPELLESRLTSVKELEAPTTMRNLPFGRRY